MAVSKYWADFFNEIGCRKVKVIYNAFDPAEFDISKEEITNFLTENDIDQDRPLIHIGYASGNKCFVEVCNALKDEDYTLIMSGPLNRAT